jgi:methionyl aminopeptidase
MTIETPHDLAGIMAIGRVVGLALARMSQAVRPGMTTAELDEVGRLWLEANGARPAPAITYGFPGVACISVNEEAAHGIPGERVIEPGDIVKIDVSAERGGFFADAAVTVVAGPAAAERERLVRCAEAALGAAIDAAQAGRPLHGMGAAAERVARRSGYTIVRELCAHGIGRSLHEAPAHIPQFYRAQSAERLAEGLVITVEPHVAAGAGRIREQANGWTLTTLDRRPVAAFEHTIIVTRGRPIIVTSAA